MTTPLVLVGEAYGTNEARISAPFVGASGVELLRMMADAGMLTLTRADLSNISSYWRHFQPSAIAAVWRAHATEVFRTNVFNFHPKDNDITQVGGPAATALPGYPALIKGRYVRAEFRPELERLADELAHHNPNLVVCLGNTPLWALTGSVGIKKLRGTTLVSSHCIAGFKLLPTYHPAAVLRQWELRPLVIADLRKAKRELASPGTTWTRREIWVEPTLADLEEFGTKYIQGCRLLSVDIETSGRLITCVGFAPSADRALVVPFYDERRNGRSYWPTHTDETAAWRFVKTVLERPELPKLFQNGLYDITFLYRAMNIRVMGAQHDTILLHHALQPAALKDLGTLGSLYANEGAWKADRRYTRTIKRDE